ncbi:unnamed protein product [Fraxinus pennsylvanica]|uniref:Uncharacterized protein n=1 Tax=Fraxinus pennsylvanica TaxID=56036 RepID=A0AAD2A763_9LAMI|nr:unnamed protein product [Fraxinus pennsylvanica]
MRGFGRLCYQFGYSIWLPPILDTYCFFSTLIILRFVGPMKAFGGSKVVLQFISNHEPTEQFVPSPIPKGYGTIKSPHFDWHPGFEVAAEAAVEAAAPELE